MGVSTHRRHRSWVKISLRALVTATLMTAAASTLIAGARKTGVHGEQALNEQRDAVDALTAGKTVLGAAPAGITPSYYAAIVPADNIANEARVALGRKLYFDVKISRDGTVACGTCHDVSRGFTDRRGTSEGIGDKLGRRNAPTTMNAFLFSSQFWDGRASTLEEQAKLPITNPIEMGQTDGKAVTSTLAADADYPRMFQAAYGRPPNFDDVGRALATFERSLVFLDAPFDRFQRGDGKAISDDARAGWALFNGVLVHAALLCQISSPSPIGTDNCFHNIGVAAKNKDFEKLALPALGALEKNDSKESIDKLALETDLSELGRFVVTRNRGDVGAFKTEQVRNIGITAPYMHDGSFPTLWDVVDHYNKGGEANAYLDGGIEPLDLSNKEEDELVAFLFSLTDVRFAHENAAEEARQHALSLGKRPNRDDALAHRKVFPFERSLQRRAAGTPAREK